MMIQNDDSEWPWYPLVELFSDIFNTFLVSVT